MYNNEELMQELKRQILACPKQAYLDLGLGTYPYQGAGPDPSIYGNIYPPMEGTDEPWDLHWIAVAWDGHQWSIMTLPQALVERLENKL